MLVLGLAAGLNAWADEAADGAADMMPGMPGQLGPYGMSREASGTSWQPDSTPVNGISSMQADWMMMWHGMADLVYDDQGGPRGERETFSSSMLMFMARRTLPQGAFGMRLMVSADPLMGPSGYPELFQSGETADGVHPLVDRQHPHNLLMEASLSYSRAFSDRSTGYIYGGLAGEPALGPPSFMHRFSSMDNPEAPLGHHWLDSTHVTYGVLTGGYEWDRIKLEASAFNGREPDQNRYRVELGRLDSFAVRLSYNPLPELALQISTGRLASPEQLEPNVAVRRTTASLSYNYLRSGIESQATLAWGHNQPQRGTASDAWLLESALRFRSVHTVFARAERVDKDELFTPGQPSYGPAYPINAFSLGYIYDFARWQMLRCGVGAMGTIYAYPSVLDRSYGQQPASVLLFLRLRL